MRDEIGQFCKTLSELNLPAGVISAGTDNIGSERLVIHLTKDAFLECFKEEHCEREHHGHDHDKLSTTLSKVKVFCLVEPAHCTKCGRH